MPKPVKLPQAAIDHMSDKAKEHLPEHLQDNFSSPFHFGTPGNDSFVGTTGEIDYFIFNTEFANTDPEGRDTIVGFEPEIDRLIYTNWGEDDSFLKTGIVKSSPENPIADLQLGFMAGSWEDRLTNVVEVQDVSGKVTFKPEVLPGDFIL